MALARDLFPGGVNSPVRAFGGVGGEPFVVARGEGARIWDVDDNEYIDYVLSWGPLVLGHAAPVVLDALRDTMARGTSFGIPNGLEVTLAGLVRERMPHVEMMRFVSSGTEATMSALRLARAATGRDLLLKFDGCYHGHADSFLVRAGSGVATLGLPNSPGVPDALAALTLTAPFNDVAAIEAIMRQHGERIAAIFVEPVVGNAGFIAPDAEFLPALRRRVLRRGARPHHARQGDRRRSARGGVWRAPGSHATRGACRADVPGRHAVRQSARHGRGHRHTHGTHAGSARGHRAAYACARGRAATHRGSSRCAVHRRQCRLDVRVLLPRRACAIVRRCANCRRRAVSSILSCGAGSGRVSRPVAVRGRLHVRGAWGRRDRVDARAAR